jgi:hypothetical protein
MVLSRRNYADELHKRYSMAGNVGDGYRGLAGRLSKEVQKELGILAIPLKQCVVDYLGSQRQSVCAHCPAALPRLLEY